MDEASNYIFQSVPSSYILYGFLYFSSLAIKWDAESTVPVELHQADGKKYILIASYKEEFTFLIYFAVLIK